MGLINLLTAGRSLVGLGNLRPRYTMAGESKAELVPNFGKKPSPRGPASRRAPKPEGAPTTAISAASGLSATATNPAESQKSTAPRPFQRAPKPPVTGVVPVVRNDLRHADLEVVPVGNDTRTDGVMQKLKISRVVQACLAWF